MASSRQATSRHHSERAGQRQYPDEEADEMWDEALDSYLDDCVLPDVAENVRHYFDREAWKRDAQGDGRAHSISTYDGDENEIYDEEDGETYYIYRTN